MKNLTSIQEHSDWLDSLLYTNNRKWELHRKRIEFGKQKLELWQFVPCRFVDGVWKILKEPKEYKNWVEIQKHGGYSLCHNSNEYQKALDMILFEGVQFADVQPSTTYNYYHFNYVKIFEANNQYNFFSTNGFKIIEDLVKVKPKLTLNSQKQIGI